MIWLILIVPGLVVAYFMFLRPVLHGIPQLAKFYMEADGFWAKVKAIGGNSATLAWSYVCMGVGWLFQWADPIATMFGDPDFKTQLSTVLQANPQVLGYVLMGVSAITIAARMRSIGKVA